MVKTKIIAGDLEMAEDAVNEFIKDKTVIDIKYQSVLVHRTYSPNGIPIRSAINDRVLIIYQEDD